MKCTKVLLSGLIGISVLMLLSSNALSAKGGLPALVEQNSADIADIKDLIGGLPGLEERVEVLEGTVEEHADAIGENKSNISLNEDNIETNTEDIASLKADIEALKDALADLANQCEECCAKDKYALDLFFVYRTCGSDGNIIYWDAPDGERYALDISSTPVVDGRQVIMDKGGEPVMALYEDDQGAVLELSLDGAGCSAASLFHIEGDTPVEYWTTADGGNHLFIGRPGFVIKRPGVTESPFDYCAEYKIACFKDL